MKFKRMRQAFTPLFGSERKEIVARFLYAVLFGVIGILALVIGQRLWAGLFWNDATLVVLGFLLAVQIALLFVLRRGHIHQTALILLAAGWIGITYQAWSADGVRDVVIYVYVLIIFMGALLMSWRVSLTLFILSVAAIWFFAVSEARGWRPVSMESPFRMAWDLTAIFLILILLVYLLVNALRQALDKMQSEIADRAQAEIALVKSDERFRRVFHKSPVAIVITSLDEGRVIDANAAYWRLSRLNPETSIGRTALELRQDLKPEQRAQFVKELLEKKSIQNPSYDFVNDRGEQLKTIAFYELIELAGKPAILSMFHDMTEQSRARDALRRSETRLRAMLEAVPDMVLEVRRDGTIAHVIPAANDQLNFLPEEILGKTVAQVLPAIAEQTAFAMERALDSGQLHAFEFDIQVTGEQKTFESRVSPVASDLALVMIRDISLNKWWQAEREKLIGELEQKNAELERFTYTVSHDLKSPIITIRGFLGFVREDAMAGNMPRLEKDIQRINDATEKMQRLLADLLELSRVGRINQKPVIIPTNELVEEVVELLHGRLMAGRVEVSVQDNLPLIYGDRPRIFEVFQNLIDNAAKFMGAQPEPLIEIGADGERDGKSVFYVRDNGVGILAQYQNRIFGLFDKLNPDSEGTGIGLALVKRIVEFHGGTIWVESEAGDGATFFLSLPSEPKSAV